MAQLSVSELLKPFRKGSMSGKPRVVRLAEMFINGEPIELSNGKKVVLQFDQEVYDILAAAGRHPSQFQHQLKKITFTDQKTKQTYTLNSFKKTIDFGGIPDIPQSVVAEAKTAERINLMIQNAIKLHNFKDGVPFYTKGKIVGNVESAYNIENNPKSDLALVDKKGNEIAWISYKTLNDDRKEIARSFQQWGGITSPTMQQFAQVQQFISAVRDRFPDGMEKSTTVGWYIKGDRSSLLKLKAVYGDNYEPAARYSRNNVNFVVQGKLVLKEHGKGYTVDSSDGYCFENGAFVPGNLEPILIARFDSGRQQFNIPNSRFLIYPRSGITPKEWLN